MPSIRERRLSQASQSQGVVDPPGSTPNRRASLKVLSRNIEKVVLGNMLFETWYYSPYPDSIINPTPYSAKLSQTNGMSNGISNTHYFRNGIACSLLYVCPICFNYTPSHDAYLQHLSSHHSAHLSAGFTESDSIEPVPDSAFKVYEHDGYSVWEVDGEKEKFYCQNLSLFGKLFLEQKSVFFDTGGFKYYVLTHTPSLTQTTPSATSRSAKTNKSTSPSTTTAVRGKKRKSSDSLPDCMLSTRVLGFFSKEDLSWDSNNLACILIFPPYQHRKLGQLLMSVSYKLSGWEWEGGVIGGPEKPLSSMGRRSYTRFWEERIARYILGITEDADQRRAFEGPAARRVKGGIRREEVSLKELGDRMGMLPEDVVCALSEMGVTEVRHGKKKKKAGEMVNGNGPAEDESEMAMMAISRKKVLAWAEANNVDVLPNVKEEGFLGEWALSDADADDESVEEEQDS